MRAKTLVYGTCLRECMRAWLGSSTWWLGVFASALQQVCTIEGCCIHLDHDLTVAKFWMWNIVVFEVFWTTRLDQRNALHSVGCHGLKAVLTSLLQFEIAHNMLDHWTNGVTWSCIRHVQVGKRADCAGLPSVKPNQRLRSKRRCRENVLCKLTGHRSQAVEFQYKDWIAMQTSSVNFGSAPKAKLGSAHS